MMPHRLHSNLHEHLWRRANIRLLPSALVCIGGATLSYLYGNVRSGDIDRRLIALLGVVLFIFFATTFLHVLTKTIYKFIASYLSSGRAAALQFVMRLFGYIAILLATLDLLGIPVGKLLLGGAAVGIILGVAAQQALANFFASMVLIIAHPFFVGEHVTINSGALGGKYIGKIKDIGLTHTKLKSDDGILILLPNATLLSSATITRDSPPKANPN